MISRVREPQGPTNLQTTCVLFHLRQMRRGKKGDERGREVTHERRGGGMVKEKEEDEGQVRENESGDER